MAGSRRLTPMEGSTCVQSQGSGDPERPASSSQARGDRSIRRGGVFRLRAITARLPTVARSGECAVIRPRLRGSRGECPSRRRVRGGFSPPSILKRSSGSFREQSARPVAPRRQQYTPPPECPSCSRVVFARPAAHRCENPPVTPPGHPEQADPGNSCVDTALFGQVSFSGSQAPTLGRFISSG